MKEPTVVVSVRLPKATYDKLKSRMLQTTYQSLSDYVCSRLVYDTHRKHGTKSK